MDYGFGGLLSEESPSGTIYVQTDQVGSPNLMTDNAGVLQGKTSNLPFGERFGHTGVQSSRRFTNHEDQPGSPIYMQARTYLPAYGKFAEPDPVYDQAKDDPESWNLYNYVTNNPVTHIDPDGRLAFPWHFGITFYAARNSGMGSFASLKLAWKAMAVDFRPGSQLTDATHTNEHAMAGIKEDGQPQSAEEAHAGTQKTIADAVAINPETGKPTDLALAVHATEDGATLLHKDKQWPGFHADKATVTRILKDIFPAKDTVKKAYDNACKEISSTEKAATPPQPPPPPPPPLPPTPEPTMPEGSSQP